MSTQISGATGTDPLDSPEPSAKADSVWRMIVDELLRPIFHEIRGDARIWFLPVIAACIWCRDERMFVALPLVMGLLFVWLLHRQRRREIDDSDE